jgi:hypothetical protein
MNVHTNLNVFVTTPAPRINIGNAITSFGLFLTCREKVNGQVFA